MSDLPVAVKEWVSVAPHARYARRDVSNAPYCPVSDTVMTRWEWAKGEAFVEIHWPLERLPSTGDAIHDAMRAKLAATVQDGYDKAQKALDAAKAAVNAAIDRASKAEEVTGKKLVEKPKPALKVELRRPSWLAFPIQVCKPEPPMDPVLGSTVVATLSKGEGRKPPTLLLHWRFAGESWGFGDEVKWVYPIPSRIIKELPIHE